MKKKLTLNNLNFTLPEEEKLELTSEAKKIAGIISQELKKGKIDADVFLGGSFAKGTLIRSERYDVDIFIRFGWEYENLSEKLERVVKNTAKNLKKPYEKVHGSRDYFRIVSGKATFEIVPVTRIKKPKEARNVTDLSYFHVKYMKRKLNEKLRNEIALAKTFCKAHEVYGAESYIQGFSGYALECLVVHYKTFKAIAKALAFAEERIVIDSEKQYKRKDEILLSMNESRIQGPMVLIDPTWKERNVLAALSRGTFAKFQEALKEYLKNPRADLFKTKEFNEDKFRSNAKKKKAEYIHTILTTDKQAGDIAGTKLKKFSNFMISELRRYFTILDSYFTYSGGKEAQFYLSLKGKDKIMKIGPPVNMKEACANFRAANKKIIIKSGVLYAIVDVNETAREYISNWMKKYADTIKSMDVVGIKID